MSGTGLPDAASLSSISIAHEAEVPFAVDAFVNVEVDVMLFETSAFGLGKLCCAGGDRMAALARVFEEPSACRDGCGTGSMRCEICGEGLGR